MHEGETTPESPTDLLDTEDGPDDVAPLVRRYRCLLCWNLTIGPATRCGSCGGVCSVRPVDLPRAQAVIPVTLPYRMRRRDPNAERDGGGAPGFDPQEPEDEEDLDESEEEDDTVVTDEAPTAMKSIVADATPRRLTGLPQFDAMLGGGLPLPGVIMLAATPGLGKSRFTLEVAARRAQAGDNVLVACVEESMAQVTTRGHEMRFPERFPRAFGKGKLSLAKTDRLEQLLLWLDEKHYSLVIVDSAFMMTSAEVHGESGQPIQLAHVVKTLYARAHATGDFAQCRPFTLIIVAHATKDNKEAGVNKAKHWVDCAIFGERTEMDGSVRADQRHPPPDGQPQYFWWFSSGKNRFGSSSVVAHYEMTPTPHGIPIERVPSEKMMDAPKPKRVRRSKTGTQKNAESDDGDAGT